MEPAADATLAELLDQVPSLAGRPRRVTELPGGLTNKNFRIELPAGTYVARVASGGSELLVINREHEYLNSVRAAKAGVGAPVVEFAPDVGVLVLGYIEGHTYSNLDVAQPANLPRVARACKALHRAERFEGDFDIFQIQRRYLDVVTARGINLPDGYDELGDRFAAMEQALAVRQEGTVPCNNDLLAANFIDDGSKLWLIDYEYSGNNDPCFELGNIWAECQLSDQALVTLIGEYYGRPLRSKIARAKLLGLAGKYGWTLWGSIQAAVSPIDFDFWSWAMERFEGAVAGLLGHGFDRLLDEVQRDD
jgi:thiamine kinase-like enzyme